MKHTLTILIILEFFSVFSLKAQTSKEIWDYYSQRNLEKTVKFGKQALQKDPNNPQINLAIGRALADSKNFKKAIPYLKKGSFNENNADWVRAWSLGYLGVCYYVTDNYKLSKKSLKKCIQLKATKNSIKYAQKRIKLFQMSKIFDSWDIFETENLRIHFQNKNQIKDVKSYISGREEAYQAINGFFKADLYKKIDYFIWNDRNQAKMILGRELGFANSDLCLINSANNQTRGHELTHILLDYGIQPIKKTRFINEGVAVYFDQTNRDRYKIARESLNQIELNIIDLWDNPEKYPSKYNYTVGGAFIGFLLENGGESKFKKLLANQSSESAAEIYDEFEKLIDEFEKRIKK
jgi:tetratricopeptide (TPR) repeat protein